MDSTSEQPKQQGNKPDDTRRTPTNGMGGAYDGDIPEMEQEQSGTASHYPSDAASDTGRGGQPATEAQPNPGRDPDMDMGNHARDVQRDMIGPSENTMQPEMREPRRADHLSEDSEESDAIPRGSDETAGIP